MRVYSMAGTWRRATPCVRSVTLPWAVSRMRSSTSRRPQATNPPTAVHAKNTIADTPIIPLLVLDFWDKNTGVRRHHAISPGFTGHYDSACNLILSVGVATVLECTHEGTVCGTSDCGTENPATFSVVQPLANPNPAYRLLYALM